MSNASAEAHNLARAYYKSHNQLPPAQAATSLMNKIRVRHNRWTDPRCRDQAAHIIDQAQFDVDDLAENFLGLSLSIESLERFDAVTGAAVFGAANPRTGEIRICERAANYEPLYRATLMHEVGHECCPV